MVWDALIGIVLSIVTWLLTALPDYTPGDSSGASAIKTLIGGIYSVSPWINVTALFGVLGLFAVVEAAVVTSRGVQWVYAKIPAKAT